MSDIGSDSDATIADSIEEGDIEEDVIEEDVIGEKDSGSGSSNLTVGYEDCALSLQAGQKLLFDKLENITAERTTVQYVQGLQDDYLILEESLHELSNITRLERKQLSDELEVASTTGKSDRSFREQLLKLSDKQKTLLQCFDNQKILGSQLKILISSQNRYSTRSKSSLQQAHSQEYTSSGCHSNAKPISTKVEAPKVAIVTTSNFIPGQSLESSIKLPSSSQLTNAVVGQMSKTVSNTGKVKSLKQKNLVGVSKKNQQSQSGMSQKIISVGVAKKQTMGVASQPKHAGDHQQPVGVAKQAAGGALDDATPKQAVETTTHQSKSQCPVTVTSHQQKSVGVAMQQQQPLDATVQPMSMASMTIQKQPAAMATKQSEVGVARSLNAATSVGVATEHSKTQKQSMGVATKQSVGAAKQTSAAVQQQSLDTAAQLVGVATQHSTVSMDMQKQPVGVATESQSMEIDTDQQPQFVGGATQHSQPVNKGKHTVLMQQPRGVAIKQPMRLLLHSELAQPVPLDVLVQHQLLSPQDQCLTCTLMGCQFVGSLATDGTIVNQDGRKFSNPPQWLNNCWATLGHSKRVDRRTAYSKVNYKDKSLLHYCLIYSQQKVTSYLNRSHDHMSTNKTTPLADKTNIQPEDMIDMTEKHWICPISDHELVVSSEWLPVGFWESGNTVLVNSDIENDVNF